MATSQHVLIVDDDEAIRASMAESLRKAGREIRVAEGAAAALKHLSEWRAGVVICDVRMPDLGGLELLSLLTERAADADVIMMTAFDDMPTVVSAMRGGAVDFFVKPVDLHELRRTVDRLFADRAVRREAPTNGESAAPTGALVGRTPAMIETFKLIGQAAAIDATVLVRGESGTGKELVARAIHGSSRRATFPFVPVNCAALPSSLLESELFGHVRGSFTGATSDRRGRFAMADRGSIFLDEIGDTSTELQSKLLRALQNREYQPVGSEATHATDARVIAATHRPLETMIESGLFRQDLYYRLRVVEIVIPPLRERADDIPLLARHFLERASSTMAMHNATISPDAMRVLQAYAWPGNVRELEHCLTRAIVKARGGVIHSDDLTLGARTESSPNSLSSLEGAERDHLARVFSATGFQKAKTAEILGVSRPRLDRLLRKHGLG
ncbi:MAG TPA: sigma-54 dependent transcriptional regulator [Gemmatimonadaceae bacterium]